MNLCLIIPTKNKTKILKRLLSFYTKIGFLGQIIILDSSDDNHLRENSAEIKKTNKLNISHLNIEGSYFEVIAKAHSIIEKDYYVCCGDDDFFNLEVANKGIKFLDNNRDFISYTGNALILLFLNNKNFKLAMYKTRSFLQESSKERLLNLLKNYCVTNFYINRTIYLKKINVGVYKERSKDHELNERLNSILNVIYGKIYKVNEILFVRTFNNSRTPLPKNMNFFLDENDSILKFFFKKISNSLVNVGSFNKEEIEIFIKKNEKGLVLGYDTPSLFKNITTNLNKKFTFFIHYKFKNIIKLKNSTNYYLKIFKEVVEKEKE